MRCCGSSARRSWRSTTSTRIRSIAARFVPYYELERLAPPANTRRPQLWRAAIDSVRTPPDDDVATFLHRDYHPGNTLWLRGRLSGVVDWTGAAWGPPAADLAQLRANLGADVGVGSADRARDAYLAAGGVAPNGAWWDVRTLLDWGELVDGHGSVPGLDRVEAYLETLLERL